jgi:hypothetical protein
VSAAAASATQGLAVASFISTGLAVLVIFLFQFEIEQVRLSRLFGFLAGRIERAFLELDTNKLKRGFATPVIGGEIVKAKEVRRQRRRFRWWLIWPILDGSIPLDDFGGRRSRKIGQFGDPPIWLFTYFSSS